MANTRVPSKPKDFDSYINNTSDDVESTTAPTVQTRFGWSVDEADDWTDKRTKWNLLNKKYTNKNLSAPQVKKDVKTFIKDFHVFSKNLLDRAASAVGSTSEDEALYNFKKERATPSHSDTPMTALVYAIITAIGGGSIVLRCRTESDATKSRIPRELGADSVQIAYKVGVVPANADDGTIKLVSTKAKFLLALGSGASEERLYVYVRWYNTKRPELSGPWSKVQIILIA